MVKKFEGRRSRHWAGSNPISRTKTGFSKVGCGVSIEGVNLVVSFKRSYVGFWLLRPESSEFQGEWDSGSEIFWKRWDGCGVVAVAS